MNPDFEKQLQGRPLRELPRDWRAEILAGAAGGARRPSTWPSSRAWAALGAVWLVILLLHFGAPDGPLLAHNSSPIPSFAMLHERTRLMAQLIGQSDSDLPPAALPAPPKPRSERARQQLSA